MSLYTFYFIFFLYIYFFILMLYIYFNSYHFSFCNNVFIGDVVSKRVINNDSDFDSLSLSLFFSLSFKFIICNCFLKLRLPIFRVT